MSKANTHTMAWLVVPSLEKGNAGRGLGLEERSRLWLGHATFEVPFILPKGDPELCSRDGLT